MSRAYQSTLNISFDVRSGLLIRQVHHWSADLFVAAVCLRLIRVFFRGRFRRSHWLIWVGLLLAGMLAGLSGAILPDDMLSGGSLSVLTGVILSLPVVGTHLAMLIFGGSFPGHVIIPRDYWVHIVVLPVVLGALLLLSYRSGRPRPVASGGRHGRSASGGSTRCCRSPRPCWSRSARLAQINPVWLFGPYVAGQHQRGFGAGLVHGLPRRGAAGHAGLGALVRRAPAVAGRADPRGDRARAVLHAGRRVPTARRLDRRRPAAPAGCCRPSPPIQRTGSASASPGSRCTGCCGRRPRTTRSRTTSRSRCTR